MTEQEMDDLEAFLNTLTDEDQLQVAALNDYLAKQGNVCLGKFDWPIDVSQQDFQHNARDAIQMPVLEKLGLVTSTVAERVIDDEGEKQTIPVKRYELTKVGLQSYLSKDTTRGAMEHRKDLCAATLTLDKVVRWQEGAQSTPNEREGTIFYTYHVSATAPWMQTPDAQKVFPMVDKVIKGEGTMELAQRLQLKNAAWIAVLST